MKLAILADIHANLRALHTVAAHLEAWQPDRVIIAGDVVNRGPRSLDCLRFVQEKQRTHGWHIVRGNHEEYVIGHSRPDAPRSGPEFEVNRYSYQAFRQLNGDVSALEALPFSISVHAPDGSDVRVTHASMRGNRDGIYPKTTDDELRQQIGPPPAPTLFCVGHTHIPLVRRIDSTLVVNVGAVGMPFDGDPRASYGQVSWHAGAWHAAIIRLPYDRHQAERDFRETNFLEESGPLGYLILHEFQHARPRLFSWATQYHARVLAGEISLEASVQALLAQ